MPEQSSLNVQKKRKNKRKENRHVLKENTSNQNASSNMGSL